MKELHLKMPKLAHGACGQFTIHRKSIHKVRETSNLKHFYRNELDKACFAHGVTYSDSKGLIKISKDRAYAIARNRQYDEYQRALANMIYKFFDRKIRSGLNVNEYLPEELYKPVIKKFKKPRKVCARFEDNIWTVDFAKMGSLSSKNKNVKYWSCFIDVFTKYEWVKPSKDKKGKTVLDAIIEINQIY